MRRYLLLALGVTTCLISPESKAGQLIGPVPYRSAADSPFNLSELGATFFLEDFEDGALNTIGVRQFAQPGSVLAPDDMTDSVDGDDGIFDGFGREGHALQSISKSVDLSDPPGVFLSLHFEFNAFELGFLPNAFGFAWTDGPAFGAVIIDVWDDQNTIRDHHYWPPSSDDRIGDDTLDGATNEDFFLGIYGPSGLSKVIVTTFTHDSNINSFELDHLQYGLAVPEPNTVQLIAIASLALFACWSRRATEFV